MVELGSSTWCFTCSGRDYLHSVSHHGAQPDQEHRGRDPVTTHWHYSWAPEKPLKARRSDEDKRLPRKLQCGQVCMCYMYVYISICMHSLGPQLGTLLNYFPSEDFTTFRYVCPEWHVCSKMTCMLRDDMCALKWHAALRWHVCPEMTCVSWDDMCTPEMTCVPWDDMSALRWHVPWDDMCFLR